MYSLPTFANETEDKNFKSPLPLPSVFASYSNNGSNVSDNLSSPFFTLGSGFSASNNSIKSQPQPKRKSWGNFGTMRFTRKGNNFGNAQFCCDPCGRAYSDQDQLNEHLAEHIKCDFEGCSFQAHAKIVELHKKLQHYSGFAWQIMKLDNPEDIKKWREERRKNFPTAANIKKRQAEQAEKAARGELIETKSFGKMKTSRNHNNYSKRPKFRRRRRKRTFNHQNVNKLKQNNSNKRAAQVLKSALWNEETENAKGSVQVFKGITINNGYDEEMDPLFENTEFSSVRIDQGMNSDNNSAKYDELSDDLISDSEDEFVPKSSAIVSFENAPCNDNFQKNKTLNSNLIMASDDINFSLLDDIDETKLQSSYFVADKIIEESDDEKPIEQKIVKQETEDNPLQTKIGGALGSLMLNYGSDSEEEKQEDQNTTAEIRKEEVKNPPEQLKNKNTERRPPMENKRKFRPHYTLLEKLLAKEIRHERNVILQCVHYIVENNFFDLIQS